MLLDVFFVCVCIDGEGEDLEYLGEGKMEKFNGESLKNVGGGGLENVFSKGREKCSVGL